MSSYRDENRPSTLVAFTLAGAGGGAALQATTRAMAAAVGLQQGRIIRPGSDAGEPRVVDFRDASRAFAFALEALRMAERYNERHADAPLEVRFGVHHDTVWFVGEEVIGDALAVATHLAGLASPGAVCASAEALSHLGNAAGWQLTQRPSARAPGVEKEIPVLEARPRATTLPEQEGPAQDVRPPGASVSAARADVEERRTRAPRTDAPLPPRPPAYRSPGQEIIAGLTEIGRAVVNELAERSKGITEEKVRAAIRRSATGWEHQARRRDEDGSLPEGSDDDDEEERSVAVSADALQRKKQKAARRAGGAITGFVSHATSFALVNAGLIALNLTVAGGYPWSFFPLGGWGIGLICHFQAMRRTRRKARELKSLQAVNAQQLGLVEKIQRVEGGFGGHTAAYVSVIGFLAGVNLITSAGHLWFLYPAVAWGIGYAIHWTRHIARKAGLIRRLADAGLSWRDIRAGRSVSGGHAVVSGPILVAPAMEYYELVREARSMRDSLLRQLGEHEEIGKRMGSDVTELLTTYSEQLEKLVLRNDEFRRTLESLPEAQLEQEIADYRSRIPDTDHAALKQEYEKAVEQGERQLRSVRELSHQREILRLRIQSAFGLLKQLEFDFVRLKNAASSDDVQGLASIRSKSHEITDYLEGLGEVEKES